MDNNDIAIVDEPSIRDMVYEIRGQPVMLDFDLARLYGYETRRFNEQVKNNQDRFPEGFMFCLTNDEAKSILRSKKATAKTVSSKRRYNPYAFTEQGIYMLMTVLKGDLAVRQSIALIKLFKSMKDYIVQDHVPMNGFEITKRFESAESRIGLVESKLDLVMKQFSDPAPPCEILILGNQRIEAGIAYRRIYSEAKETIIVIDDYIGMKTLHLLKACPKEVKRILLLSDNVARTPLSQSDLDDFTRDTSIPINLVPTGGRFHDRYIILDYGSPSANAYHCGPSSKDAGNAISTIMKMEYPQGLFEAVGALINLDNS